MEHNMVCTAERLINISDCELHTEDGEIFPANKANLAIKSEYFLSLFCDNEDAKIDNQDAKIEIFISGIKGETLRNILSYIDADDIIITENNFADILQAAHKLQINDLLGLMKENLAENLTLKNSTAIFSAAHSTNQVDIFRHCFRFVETQFVNIVECSDKSFNGLHLEELQLLLNDKNLRVSDEKTVWKIIVEWVTADLPNRLHFVPVLLLCLATEDVDENLAKEIVEDDIVANNKFCRENNDLKLPYSNFNDLHLDLLLKNPEKTLFTHRRPSTVHFIFFISSDDYYGTIPKHTPMYVTYDDKIDLWRKVAAVNYQNSFLLLNDSVYVFGGQEFRRYSIVEKEWYQCRYFITDPTVAYSYNYRTVRLGRKIYMLGGNNVAADHVVHTTYNVRFYDSEVDDWFETAAMFPVEYFKAVVLKECIYVIGKKPNSNSEIVAQVYSTHEQVWGLLPNPSMFGICHLVTYHDKIYCIGRDSEKSNLIKNVQVFDPSKNAWNAVEDLPYSGVTSKASVINDRLIVCGRHNRGVFCEPHHLYSTVMWEETKNAGKLLMSHLHALAYTITTFAQ